MRPHLPATAHLARICSNGRSLRVVRRQLDAPRGAAPAGAAREAIQLRPLRGETIHIRPGTSDAAVAWETFVGRYHLPPDELPSEAIGLIWDLGANIGLTMAHLAVRHPRATIVGVELDPANASLARENVGPWRERCDVLQAAVWTEDGEVGYEGAAGMEYGYRVAPGTGSRAAAAVCLGTLLERCGRAPDYVKMDIEGAERDVLRANTGWAAGVRAIKVEVHPPYGVGECVGDLERLGFSATADRRHWACAIGVRVQRA